MKILISDRLRELIVGISLAALILTINVLANQQDWQPATNSTP
jgi:hypothetical protein